MWQAVLRGARRAARGLVVPRRSSAAAAAAEKEKETAELVPRAAWSVAELLRGGGGDAGEDGEDEVDVAELRRVARLASLDVAPESERERFALADLRALVRFVRALDGVDADTARRAAEARLDAEHKVPAAELRADAPPGEGDPPAVREAWGPVARDALLAQAPRAAPPYFTAPRYVDST